MADSAADHALLVDSQHLRDRLTQLRRSTIELPAAAASASLKHSQQLIADGLAAAASLVSQAAQPATMSAQQRHVTELQTWLAANFPCSSLADCCPELLAVYVTMHWLPSHVGSAIPATGELVVAPASLANMLSHLSSYFEHVEGRSGPHQLLQGVQHGNPILSSAISQLRKGYSNQMRCKGVSQGAAVPVTFSQVQQLLEAHRAALAESEPGTILAVLLARDAFLISLLWHTALRGDNAGRLRTQDCISFDGQPVCSELWAAGELVPGSEVFLRPDGTKTLRAANSGRVAVEVLSAEDSSLCCIWWLQQLGQEYAAHAGRLLTGYLTRPLLPSRAGFADKPMSSSSVNQMLKARQQQFGIDGVLSPHGFRRGRLQQLEDVGMSLAAITQHALNKTEATIQQRYLNRDAHLNNLKRARR